MTTKHLVLVETSGNQAYVFATNKLRDVLGASQRIWQAGDECVRGASELVRQAGEDFVVDAIEKVTNKGSIMVATSGKALVLFDTQEDAKAFVTAWSKKLLTEAPGLDGTGVFSRATVDLDAGCGGMAEAVKEVHQRFASARAWRRSPEARFARLPIVAPCDVSGRAANCVDHEGEREVLVSKPVKAKRDAVIHARKRLQDLHEGLRVSAVDNPSEIERMEQLDWVAVIHADGNGLGEIFLKFHNYVGKDKTGEDYRKDYAAFSKALDDICRDAYRAAVKAAFKKELELDDSAKKKIPIIPIVVAGDDLTVIMDGKKALQFTEVFVKKFCEFTQDSGHEHAHRKRLAELCAAAKDDLRAPRLGMAAGVCICKPHFPFSTAYTLAEQLMRNAKKVKTELNKASAAIDFHILYDTTATSIEAIREKLWPQGPSLTGKPFVVDAIGTTEKGVEVKKMDWFKTHNWEAFQAALAALQAKDGDGKRLLPSGQAHAVRDMLFSQETGTQEAEWKLLLSKYGEFKKQWGNDKLYVDGTGDNGNKYTLFLDALEAADFYKTSLDNTGKQGETES